MKEANQFLGPRAKLRSVKRKGEQFRAEFNSYVEMSRALPDSIKSILKPPSIDYVVVANLPPIPDDLAVLIGEIVVQLRSCLDQLACELATLSGAENVKGVYFPIAKNEADYFARGTRDKIRKLRKDIQDIIDSYKPYGDSIFVALNTLANTDKHQKLIDAVPNVEQTLYKFFGEQPFKRLEFWARNPAPLEHRGAELLRIPADSPINGLHLSLDCSLVFAVEPIVGEPVAETIMEMARAVEDVISTFERHCFP